MRPETVWQVSGDATLEEIPIDAVPKIGAGVPGLEGVGEQPGASIPNASDRPGGQNERRACRAAGSRGKSESTAGADRADLVPSLRSKGLQ